MVAGPVDLRRVFVRPIAADERKPFDRLLVQEHHLHNASLVGEMLRYVATDGERWLALLAWSTAAFKCKPRDAWIGWPERVQWRRLKLVANNARFLVLPDARQPHLASRVLALNCRRLPSRPGPQPNGCRSALTRQAKGPRPLCCWGPSVPLRTWQACPPWQETIAAICCVTRVFAALAAQGTGRRPSATRCSWRRRLWRATGSQGLATAPPAGRSWVRPRASGAVLARTTST